LHPAGIITPHRIEGNIESVLLDEAMSRMSSGLGA
jgi:hypothetical protein